MHLVKLCVGVACVSDLADRQLAHRRASKGMVAHRTRQTPRRRDDILEAGSLYWVIAGSICVRQRILDLAAVTGEDGIERCDIVLDRKLIATQRRPRRPFQGWRYLSPADAPHDLTRRTDDAADDLMRATLLELGLI